MLDSGRVWLKLSGPMRCTEENLPYPSVTPLARLFVNHAPERMVWGTNWPHPRVDDKPDEADLLDVLLDWTGGDAKTIHKILIDNPATLYGF